jgi:HPt (histidine-containing phosphotransfer) domain-containing protein
MSTSKKLEQLIAQMENHLECWKQFNQFVNLARGKKFGPEDENQFLETKSVLVQELEILLASIEVNSPSKEEVHTLIGNAPSLRYLSEMNEGALRNVENQWHKIYIGWHSILGQLKVRQQEEDSKGSLASLFASRK